MIYIKYTYENVHNIVLFGFWFGCSLARLSMVITAFYKFWPERHEEFWIKVGSRSLVKHLLGFEPGTFQSYVTTP